MAGFRKAVKRDAKLRLALCGPAGSGKTYSALRIGTGLGDPIAYVDTEHGSASKYADQFAFDVIEPDQFDPRELIATIREAAAGGYRVIIIDSLSHYWMGKGGELELVDSTAKRSQSGNSFAAWKTVTPIHNELIDTIISAPIHVIATLRTKTEWVIEENERGKKQPRKIGLAPVMRDGIEFEFDVCGDMDQENNFTVTKSRCPSLAGKVINRPGDGVAATLREWLSGAPAEPKPVPSPVHYEHANEVRVGLTPQQVAETKITQLQHGVAYGTIVVEPAGGVEVEPLTEQLERSIVEAAAKRAKKQPSRYDLLRSFGELHKRFNAIGKEASYYSGLKTFGGVDHSNEFPDTEEGKAKARSCYKAMSLNIQELEAGVAQHPEEKTDGK